MKDGTEMHSRKMQILIASARLFHKNGFKGTSLRSIAIDIGMEAPSLYNHIKSKNEILSTILLTNANTFHKRMAEISQSSTTPLEKLENLISLHIELTIDNPDAMALMLNEWVHLEETDKQTYLDLKDQYENDFLKILELNVEQNQLVDIEVNLILFMILSTLRSLYAWCSKHKEFNRIELESSMKVGILNGILKRN